MYRLTTVRGLSQACATTAFTAMGMPEADAGAQASGMAADMSQEKSVRAEVTGCTGAPAPTGASASERVAPAVLMAFAALFAS